MRFLKALTLLTFLPFAAYADDRVSNFALENGLQVLVIEDHRAPVVVNMVWYRVGSADEQSGESGLAHFLEHLMFKGTKTLAPGAFSQIVSAQGGSDNASPRMIIPRIINVLPRIALIWSWGWRLIAWSTLPLPKTMS